MNILNLISVSLLAPHRLDLGFSDGRSGTLDLLPLIETELPGVFAALRDPAVFAKVQLAGGTIVWPEDLDLAPEYLYFHCFRNDPALQEQFAAWGYPLESAHA